MKLREMRKILKGMGAALLLAAALPAAAQQTRVLTAEKHNDYGLVYSLPITALRVDVTAVRTVHVAGPYYRYAKKYLGTDKVVTEDYENWTISDVKVVPYGISDPEDRYVMQLKPGALTYICVDADGMLLSINKEVEAAPTPKPTPAKEGKKVNVKEYLQYVNEDFISAQSSARQAEMLAESLMEIRDAKISLTRGTAESMPKDGRQLELMLQSLAAQEEAMTNAFVGFSWEETVTRSFTVVPEEEGRMTLFRMSDFAGFVEADDYSGDPVYFDMTVLSEGQLPVDAKGEEKKMPKDAVVYTVPGTSRVKVSLSGRTLYEGEVDLAQFGVKFGLQPTLFTDRKGRTYAEFNPATGALVEIGTLANEE